MTLAPVGRETGTRRENWRGKRNRLAPVLSMTERAGGPWNMGCRAQNQARHRLDSGPGAAIDALAALACQKRRRGNQDRAA